MCLIAFAWQCHPRWRLLLAGNRDEVHARPTAPLSRWGDLPLIGGRDLEAGGSWLGVNDAARCCAVTNVRNPGDPQRGRSRGTLVSDYLAGERDAGTHARYLRPSAGAYRPFNLLTFDAHAACYVGNRPEATVESIAPGVHGLSNADFHTPWPKTQDLVHRLQQWIEAGHEDDFDPVFEALASEAVASDDTLPDTGIGRRRERWLSSAFIRGVDYGTRASTVVAIDHDGRGQIIERRFGPNGRLDGINRMPIG